MNFYLIDIKITGDGWKKNLINDNEYESEVFGEYLSMNCIEIQDLFEELIEQCREVEDFETTEAIVCRDCGFKILQKLAYEYRENVSDERFFGKFIFYSLRDHVNVCNFFLTGLIK